MRKIFIAFLSVIMLMSLASCASETSIPSNKKEIMDRFAAGTLGQSYAPAAFFVHFPANAKTGDPAVRSHLDYFVKANADILKVQFEQFVPRIRDYELQETWDALEWLIGECKKIGIEGFYMTTQGGEMKYYNIPGFFDNFVKPYDLEVMGECVKGTKMNILHI